jgi:predicted PurR-regulated permease PerM
MIDNNQAKYFNISALTVVKIILVLILFYFLFLIKNVLAILFVALVFASAIDPWVDWLQKRKIPRGVSMISIYLIMFFILSLLVYLIIPPILEQTNQLSKNFPTVVEKFVTSTAFLRDYAAKSGILETIKNSFGTISTNLSNAAGGVFSTIIGIFGGIFTFFLILVITFYMVVEENAIKKLVWSIAPVKHQVYIMNLINRMQKKVGLWLRGQLIVSLFVAILVFIGLSIINIITGKMPYALVLALIAGITESVPYIGPIIAAVPGVFLAFSVSPMLALVVAIMYYVVQLTENNIIVPKMMQKVVGLNPIVSIAALLIGFQIAGIVGAILSIPVATAISVFIFDLFESKIERDNAEVEK